MQMRRTFYLSVLFLILSFSSLWGQTKRTLRVDDLFALKEVEDPRISPDGEWVAFTIGAIDEKKDRSDTDVYMIPLKGGEALRLTTSEKPENSPRWSPDGKYLAFLSARQGEKTQVWLMDRRGGEAVQLTEYKSDVSELVWSPDGSRLALVVQDPDPAETEEKAKDEEEKPKTPKPIVINRLQFKRDGKGYLNELREHIYVFNLEDRSSRRLTNGPYDDSSPAWSPDGRWIAFVSNRTQDPDSNVNTDIFLVPSEGGEPVSLTSWEGADSDPHFLPDGSALLYLAGGDPGEIWYATNNLELISLDLAAGRSLGSIRRLSGGLDRNVSQPRVTPDGKHALFLVEDSGNTHLARVALAGGEIERIAAGELEIDRFDMGPGGEVVLLESRFHQPPEISRLDGSEIKRLTFSNDPFLKGIELGEIRRFQARSKDGTLVDGFLTLPPGEKNPQKLPAILRIHGGPVSQFSARFSFEWQLLAAQGYAVIAANPRGSSGKGRDFSHAIWADWGNKDFEDVMAAVDYVVQEGVADPDRLGVGGWSYGGILTNYVITRTDRFKAAVTGASEVNYLANYGHDHYQHEWEVELGLPWRNIDLWIRLSPFFQVEKVTTPTLIMGGASDWNVPIQNSEQLYQALRRLGRETQLVVYPGQGHEIRVPSYQKDRYQRYLDWYGRYLLKAEGGRRAEDERTKDEG